MSLVEPISHFSQHLSTTPVATSGDRCNTAATNQVETVIASAKVGFPQVLRVTATLKIEKKLGISAAKKHGD